MRSVGAWLDSVNHRGVAGYAPSTFGRVRSVVEAGLCSFGWPACVPSPENLLSINLDDLDLSR